MVYNLDKKEYPNGVNGFNCAPKATSNVKIASVQDVLETELAKTLGGVNDLVNAGNAIQLVQSVLAMSKRSATRR